MLTFCHLTLTVAHSVHEGKSLIQGQDPWARNQSGHHGPDALGVVMLHDASWSQDVTSISIHDQSKDYIQKEEQNITKP